MREDGLFLFLVEVDESRAMVDSWKDDIHQILYFKSEARRIDTRVAPHHIALEDILVDKELDIIVMVVHQSQYGDRPRAEVEVLKHQLLACERKSSGIDLLRQQSGKEFLIARHHKEVEFSLLFISEEEVLADYGVARFVGVHVGHKRSQRHTFESCVYFGTYFHCSCGFVIEAVVFDIQSIQ